MFIFFYKMNFFIVYQNESIKAWKRWKKVEGNIINKVTNVFRLEKEIPYWGKSVGWN